MKKFITSVLVTGVILAGVHGGAQIYRHNPNSDFVQLVKNVSPFSEKESQYVQIINR